ncbi:MAG TPA: BBP7 family outer membrane beta-barrel protein [Pirellulaceae bacterium]|nr:BBP7 family outer membrane beta-barrel protein [Pirellulaceae bacterium]
MSIHRPLILSLLALLALTAGGRSSDFSDRLSAWQGGASAAPTPAAPPISAAPRMEAAPAPAAPAPRPSNAPRAYAPEPSGHLSGPTTCGQGPSFIGPTCDGVAGCCGPAGCGGQGGHFHGGFCHGGSDCCDYSAWCCHPLVWARFDVLLWWRQGRDYPPLVTTDPVNEPSTTAGILPDATILFGGDRVASNMAVGGRFDIGTWTDPRQCWGIGWRFFGIGQDSTDFSINSLQNPVLAIPFTDANSDTNDALLIAYPGLRTGSIGVRGSSEVLGNDVYGRFLLCRDCDSRLDFITGWNYTRVNDSVTIRSSATVTEIGGNIPVGTVTDIRDDFRAHNEFNGGILGLLWERNCGCWSTQLMGRMSLGSNFEETSIRGSTQIASPGLPAQTDDQGLFAADTNSGVFSRSEFTAITEIGLRLAYRCNNCTQLTVGYTFMYWNDIATASDAIDTFIGSEAQRPRFAFEHSDFWVQGISLGFSREF